MKKKLAPFIASFMLLFSSAHAEFMDGWELFDHMDAMMSGNWVMSPKEKQTGTNSYKHPAVMPLLGTQKPGISFKLIGRGTTLQEDLLPNTAKQMVTMYHCKDIECTTLKATHYCVKQNQPEFIANLKKSTENKIIFDCDMSTQLCQSNEDHVHQIVHEFSQEGMHLKSSYFSWAEGKLKNVHSIYHFDR